MKTFNGFLITENREYGFDLTNISSDNFKKILDEFELDYKSRKKFKSYGWVWKNDKIEIVTGNDPVSGEHATGRREDEKGYASYVGISGEDEYVEKAAKMFKELSEWMKGQNSEWREFI